MRASKKPNYERPATVIGKDTTLETAKLQSKSSVQVNGKMIGDLEVEASIVVGEEGSVTGNVSSSFLLIAGTILGNVTVSQQIHMTKTASIQGDVTCGSIIVDEGAVINGNCTMTQTDTKKKGLLSSAKSGKETEKAS